MDSPLISTFFFSMTDLFDSSSAIAFVVFRLISEVSPCSPELLLQVRLQLRLYVIGMDPCSYGLLLQFLAFQSHAQIGQARLRRLSPATRIIRRQLQLRDC